MKNEAKPSFTIVEVDDEGWAAFKALEAEHRREYAASAQAVVDHEAWVNAPVGSDQDWSSAPTQVRDPRTVPSATLLPWERLHDWALEKKAQLP